MRSALALLVAVSMSAAGSAAWAQNAQSPAATPAKCENPNALGVTRVVEIDTTGAPGFGFEHFKAYDFLRDKEVVLTFDDGPWVTTPAVLKALAEQCTKALFFPIGKHAGYHPDILKRIVAEGHTVGSHTWSHKDLSRMTQEEAIAEFEKGIAAVSIGLGNKPVHPFFRFPALRHPPEMVKYLGERNVGIFSTDLDSFDFKTRKPEQVIANVMKKLEKTGKGIVLMHDFQPATAHGAAELLKRLKDGG
jgi:peptidoglycan/xylan/chitin deacetylase (PgdA/CDA1 family)